MGLFLSSSFVIYVSGIGTKHLTFDFEDSLLQFPPYRSITIAYLKQRIADQTGIRTELQIITTLDNMALEDDESLSPHWGKTLRLLRL
jgi:hypothetical protein